MELKDKIFKDALNTVNRYGMLKKKDSVLVSVSGGPDSVFLIHFLCLIREKYNLNLFCFHLDHMTRNGQSGQDALYVKKLCRDLNVHLFVETRDVKSLAKQEKSAFQDAARKLRIELLGRIAKENKIFKVAIGHTADDNIETFFMHLLRGAGLNGLAGIKPVDHEIIYPRVIIRPLIETYRQPISDYLNKNSIGFCIDRTNMENIYFRNRIRNLLIPFISENIFGGFKVNLTDTIKILREENHYLGKEAAKFLDKVIVRKETDSNGKTLLIDIDLAKFSLLAVPMKKRIIIQAIGIIKGDRKDLKNITVNKVVDSCFSGGESKSFCITENIRILKELDRLTISGCKFENKTGFAGSIFKTADIDKLKSCREKEIILKDRGFKIIFKYLQGGIELINREETESCEAFMDLKKIYFPVKIKQTDKLSGEKFFPLGLNKPKKLHDFFIDLKIPRSRRKNVFIFSDKVKIIWIGGYRTDERVKVDEKTEEIFYMKMVKI